VRPSLAYLAVLAALHFANAVAADDREIVPSDVLGLRVTDWQPVEGELREWTAITGTYVVGADGSVTFPYIGEILVAGQSPGAVGIKIGEALKQQFALAGTPFANVSIEERSPVLVGGAVENPGEVPYIAEMTARHAVALAGGILIPTNGETSITTQSLTAEAQVRILTDQVAAGALRVARLRAELDGASEIAPGNLPADSGVMAATLRADAERHLALNRERLARELELIDSKIALLDQEIVALEAKQDALNRQKLLADEQRANTEELSERGLAANARLLDAERTLVIVETQILDVATALLEARQELEAAKAERVQVVQDRSSEIMSELHTAEVELAELREKLSLQRSVAAIFSAALGGGIDTAVLSVTVYRGGAEDAEVVREGLDTPLQPGDLVEVALTPSPPPQDG
jgi:protein involved in polysaccharide export with SLBB domain